MSFGGVGFPDSSWCDFLHGVFVGFYSSIIGCGCTETFFSGLMLVLVLMVGMVE